MANSSILLAEAGWPMPNLAFQLAIGYLNSLNKRTLFIYIDSLSYEKHGDLAEISGTQSVLGPFCNTASWYDGQIRFEKLLNLLLRNYLHYILYDQVEKLRSKAPRFEAHSNQHKNSVSINEESYSPAKKLKKGPDCTRSSDVEGTSFVHITKTLSVEKCFTFLKKIESSEDETDCFWMCLSKI
ncbi:hypothetical protein YC2023_021997 [Brassica napus]